MKTASSPQNSARRWQRRKEARPAEILDAALSMFVEKGFASTRLEDVAREAGVSKGTVYLYFDSKEALLRALVNEIVIPEVDRAEKMANQYQGSAAGLLQMLAQNWWENVANSRLSGIPKLIVSESGNFPDLAEYYVQNVVKRSRSILVRVIEMGVKRGEFRQCRPEYMARALLNPMVFALIWQHSLSNFDDADYDAAIYLQLHVDLFLRGLAAHDASDVGD